MTDHAEIYQRAVDAGRQVAWLTDKRLVAENARGLDCGFAWVVVKPARGQFITWAKSAGKGRKEYGGGWFFWYSEFSLTSTQSVSVHEAAAKAFADVLRANGINAVVDSRLG